MVLGEAMQMTWALMAVWFVLFWVLGGALFAVVALTRFLKIKKAQFSCLFTFASAVAAYGAASTGLTVGEAKVSLCLTDVSTFWDAVKAVFGCGAKEVMLSGSAWFALLLLLSILLMLLSERHAKAIS